MSKTLLSVAFEIYNFTADELKKFKEEKFPKIKDAVARSIKFMLFFLLISAILVSIGVYARTSWLIVIGGLMQLSILAFAYVIAELLGIFFSIVTLGKHSAEGVKSVIRGYTVVRFIMIIIFSLLPDRANLSLLPTLLLLSFFIELLYAMKAPRLLIQATLVFSAVIVLGMFSPGGSKFFARIFTTVDSSLGEPRLLQFTSEALARDEVRFYSEGKPNCFYCLDDEKRYVLYQDEGYCPNNGLKTLPISELDRRAMKTSGAKIISPRCLIGGNLASSSATTYKPAAAPAYVTMPAKKTVLEQQMARPAPIPVQTTQTPPTQTAQATPAPVVDMSAICRHARGIVDWGDASSTGTLVNIECRGNSVILRDTEFGTVFNITKNTWSPGTGGGPFYFHMEPFSQGDTFAKGKITIASGTVTAYLREEPPPEQQQLAPANTLPPNRTILGLDATRYQNQPRRQNSVIEGINAAMRYRR